MVDQLPLGEKEISKWVRTQTKAIKSVVKLPGDASARRYYRVRSSSQSFILMKMDSFSKKESIPFIEVQKHLARSGVDVPEIYDVDPERGLLVLEDLGDTTLLRELQSVSNSETERHLYEKAIDSLVEMQMNASPRNFKQKQKVELEAFRLKFDQEKLMWEVNFTIENFYRSYLSRTIKDKDFKTMKKDFSSICKTLSSQPVVLAHRDFHSRNIMVTDSPEKNSKEKRLVMIDFQDARMGPAQYDLVSLLKDSYYQLEEAQIRRLVEYYLARSEGLQKKRLHRDEFQRVFDLMAVQRNFKAIGSFASFLNRRSDPTYLKYIGNTFENIRRSLLKYPEYRQLREVLYHYYYF